MQPDSAIHKSCRGWVGPERGVRGALRDDPTPAGLWARRTRRLVLALALAAATSGCGHKKIAECDALVKVINAGVVRLEKAPKNESDPTGIADLKSMADAMDKVATDTAAVQLTLPELKKVRDEYQKMAREIARAERELAKAAEDRNAQKRSAAEASLDAAVKAEDPLVDQLNKFCQGP